MRTIGLMCVCVLMLVGGAWGQGSSPDWRVAFDPLWTPHLTIPTPSSPLQIVRAVSSIHKDTVRVRIYCVVTGDHRVEEVRFRISLYNVWGERMISRRFTPPPSPDGQCNYVYNFWPVVDASTFDHVLISVDRVGGGGARDWAPLHPGRVDAAFRDHERRLETASSPKRR